MTKKACAILGSGNIGTDLLVKIQEQSEVLEVALLVGIDPDSDGLAKARARGIDTTADGIEGLLKHPRCGELAVVFDATSAGAHAAHAKALAELGVKCVDLTPAAIGPYVVPVANLGEHKDAANVNMVTCGGQATIPIVHAVSLAAPVKYAEIVASISSRSAGPGTRANIDEFTETTARGLEVIGGAERGKAIIVLNPAEPPLIMRDTVYCLTERGKDGAIEAEIEKVVSDVQTYVPGYRMVQRPVFEDVEVRMPGEAAFVGTKVTVLLEVEGAGDYLPAYAGNLDIMTAAARAVGERLVA
jgi:acetaldehyde dehydrogenase